MYKKIGLALAFSPRCTELLNEALRIAKLYDAKLLLIHVGERDVEKELFFEQLMKKVKIKDNDVRIIWEEKGKPANRILSVCKREKIDLLIAGAIKKENIFIYYIGSVARRLIRKASCSVLIFVKPSSKTTRFKKIIINATKGTESLRAITDGLELAKLEKAKVYAFKAIASFELMMAFEEESKKKYLNKKRYVLNIERKELEQMLQPCNKEQLPINLRVSIGKVEVELINFINKEQADLVVFSTPKYRFNFFHKLFSRDIEYFLSDIPTNMLFVEEK